MKRILILILIVLLIVPAVASCAGKVSSDKVKVIGTVFPQFDFARVIGGDDVECEMLMSPGEDSHSYSGDDPSDIYKIMNSDLFIYVGGNNDSAWVDKIKDKVESSGEKGPVFLALCDVCDLIDESDDGIVEGEEEEEIPGNSETDEHVWTSPKNAMKAASAICDALCEIDSENAEEYKTRCEEYLKELDSLDKDFKALIDSTDDKTLVFADRFPFRYLASEYGLKCYAAFNGCASQSEPSPTTIAKLCEIVEEKNLPYVFYIETSNSSVPYLISKNTGCGMLLLHSCHTVGNYDEMNNESYLSLMRKNLENLREAFTK